jgi:integrase
MAVQTFGELYSLYYRQHALTKLKCPENVKYWGTVYGERWFTVLIAEIDDKAIQCWVDEKGMSSQSAATRAVNQMGAIFNWGMKRGHCSSNPTVGVERFKVIKRDRFAFPAEIKALKLALDKQPPLIHDLIWVALLTGGRKANLLQMEWSEIDFDLKLWRIPPHKFKNGDSHLIPLVDDVLTILKRRKQSASCQWVFEGEPGQHLKDPKRAWSKVKALAQIDNLRLHDLRRTVGSYMAIDGESQYVIGKTLGHKDPRSTAVYARLDLAPVRSALEAVQATFQMESPGH